MEELGLYRPSTLISAVPSRGSAEEKQVICFFCLKKVPYSQVQVVRYKVPHIDFTFRVYICSNCLAKLRREVGLDKDVK